MACLLKILPSLVRQLTNKIEEFVLKTVAAQSVLNKRDINFKRKNLQIIHFVTSLSANRTVYY